MPLGMEEVLAHLGHEEPNYAHSAATLGPDAVPHLMRVVEDQDAGIAAQATYLAGWINSNDSLAVIERAARSRHTVVRVAAAGSLRLLSSIPPVLAIHLLNDEIVGVRKLALKSLAVHRPAGVRDKVQEVANNDPNLELRRLAGEVATTLP